MKCLILLSTYNGEKYLTEQLDSILSQTYTDWQLLIRDDGSSDNTLNIIQRYCKQDSRIVHFTDNQGNLKPCQSFAALMQAALNRNEHYIFFSDQDDVWLPEKLEKSITALQSLENKHSTNTPALVHSDLCIVDVNLKTIHASYLRYEGLTRNIEAPLTTLLINNYVTGCTMGINRALLEIATPVPQATFMHDWWCALCAAASGYIGFVSEPTMLYRQHSMNSIGSTGQFSKLKKSFTTRLANVRSCIAQAENLLDHIHTSNKHNQLIHQFASLPGYNLISRYETALKLRPASKMRALLFFTMLVFI